MLHVHVHGGTDIDVGRCVHFSAIRDGVADQPWPHYYSLHINS